MPEEPKDQRRHPRVDVELQVKLRFADVNRFRIFRTVNLSEGGVFVVTENAKPAGTRAQVVLYPPGIELGLPIHGTVVRSVTLEEAERTGARPGIGIRFEELDDDARAALTRLFDVVAAEAAAPPGSRRAVPPPPPPRPEGAERRTTGRVPARTTVRLRFSDAKLFREFYTKDLSRGGVFVCASPPLPQGTEVDLLLTPPDGSEIRLEGRVAHVVEGAPESAGMGIEFTDLTMEKRLEVAMYVGELEVQRSAETLGRVKPMASAHLRYEKLIDFERVVRGDLRRRRLTLPSEEPRPVGSEVRIFLHAPQFPDPLELHGEVEAVVRPEDAEEGGEPPGMRVRLTDLDDEYLADIEMKLRPDRPPPPATPAAAKATMLAEAALEDLKTGKRTSALANLKLALTFDPGNEYCKRLLEEVQAGRR
jgi:uncharacterized protein (TIGR02266 family)